MAHGLVRVGGSKILPPPTARPYGASGMRAAGLGSFTPPAEAEEYVLDDFEDNDLDEYSDPAGGFETSADAKYHGDYGLQINAGVPSYIYRDDNPIGQGVQFYAWVKWLGSGGDDAKLGIVWGHQSVGGEYYYALFDPENSLIEVYYYDGSHNLLGSDAFTPQWNTWTSPWVRWETDDDITASLFDGSVNVNEGSQTTGGWGFIHDVNLDDAYLDYFRYVDYP